MANNYYDFIGKFFCNNEKTSINRFKKENSEFCKFYICKTFYVYGFLTPILDGSKMNMSHNCKKSVETFTQ
jgi:hypothetical protein